MDKKLRILGHIWLHAGPQLLMASLWEILDPKSTRCSQAIYYRLTCYKLGWRHHNSSWELTLTRVQPARLFTTVGIKCRTHYYNWVNTQQANYQGLHRHICLFLWQRLFTYWSCHKPHHWGIPCCLRYLSYVKEDWGSSIPTSEPMSKASNQLQEVQHISASNPDDEGPGSLDNRRLLLEVHPTTWTTLRRPTRSSSQLHEIPPVTNLGAPNCHLWRIWHLVSWDRSLSQLLTPLCSS